MITTSISYNHHHNFWSLFFPIELGIDFEFDSIHRHSIQASGPILQCGRVSILADTLVESDEFFDITLVSHSIDLLNGPCRVIITDDDGKQGRRKQKITTDMAVQIRGVVDGHKATARERVREGDVPPPTQSADTKLGTGHRILKIPLTLISLKGNCNGNFFVVCFLSSPRSISKCGKILKLLVKYPLCYGQLNYEFLQYFLCGRGLFMTQIRYYCIVWVWVSWKVN